jgi:arylsulfatase A-like enzyme
MKTFITMTSTLLSLCLNPIIAQTVQQPNIIIFYVDDLGWQDAQLNDLDKPCPYDTPNITKLAQAGMNFTQGYSPAPTCSPSRAGIITGQHPAKIGMTHVTLARLQDGGEGDRLVEPYLQEPLDLNLLTIADAMKANGYRTGHSGKWHVGLNAASYGFEVVNQERGPHRRMDDRTKGFATDDDEDYPLSKEKYPPFSDKKPKGISYPYDEVTESALKFIGDSGDKPFFLNLCHWMVHWPALTRNGELLEYYCDKLGQAFPPKPGDMTLPGQQNPYFSSMVTTVDWIL